MEGEKNSFTWDAEAMKADEKADNGYTADATHKLLLRQILLGPTAEADDLNVVEIETVSVKGKVKIPIAVLKASGTSQIRVDLEFPDSPVIFTLTQGKGPVHILGQHLEQLTEEEINMDEGEDEEDDDDEVSDDQDVKLVENPSKKQKLDNNHKKAGKKGKKE